MPNVAAQWEFIATSTTSPGYSTGVEVALQQGTVFTNDNYYPDGQISAASTQIGFIGLNYLNGSSKESIVFGGNCTPATSDTGNSLTGNISGLGGTMNFSYTEGGNVFNVTALLNASGQSMVGTYTEVAAQSGENGICNDDGTATAPVLDAGNITGTTVSKISGTYTGKVCQPSDTTCTNPLDAATAAISQSGSTLTINLLLAGADDASLTLTGPVAANYFSVQGTFAGSPVSYQGYVKYVFDSLDNLYDTPDLYLENAACSTSNPGTCMNLLTIPVVP